MIRLTQSSWIACSGVSRVIAEPTHTKISATTLTVSWNCRKRWILSKMFLPHMQAFTIELKLSSVRRMSAAS